MITTDARLFEGILEGYDNSTNIILRNCIERIINTNHHEHNQTIDLGLYILRGGNVVCVGEIDETEFQKIDWDKLKGEALKGTKNPL